MIGSVLAIDSVSKPPPNHLLDDKTAFALPVTSTHNEKKEIQNDLNQLLHYIDQLEQDKIELVKQLKDHGVEPGKLSKLKYQEIKREDKENKSIPLTQEVYFVLTNEYPGIRKVTSTIDSRQQGQD